MPAAVFPTISYGDAWLAPATRTLGMATEVARFLDDSEQRWRASDPLNGWALTFGSVEWPDVATIENFFATVKGAFDATWSFVFLGTTFTGMGLEQDDFTAVEGDAGRYTVSLRLRQTAKSGAYATGAAAVYPTINGGVVTQRPFTSKGLFLTTRNDLPTGARYAWAERPAPLGAWTCAYPTITAAELGTLVDFFTSMGGRYGQFSFTDPNTGAVHASCRLDMDALQIRYLGAGVCAVTLAVAEYAA